MSDQISIQDQALLEDKAAREKAITCHDVTFCIEASAGTGKTTLIVEKISDLILEHAVPIRSIVAITFTEKAALELKERVRESLSKEIAQRREASEIAEPYSSIGRPIEQDKRSPSPGKATPEERQARARAALRDFDLAEISTIHSFCQRILREFPFEAGIDPGSTVLDEINSERLFADCWHTWLTSLMSTEAHDERSSREDPLTLANDLRTLFVLGLKNENLTEFVRTSYNERDILPLLTTAASNPENEQYRSVVTDKVITELKIKLAELVPYSDPAKVKAPDNGQKLIFELLRKIDKLGSLPSELRDRFLLEELRITKLPGSQNNWYVKDDCKAMKAIFEELKERFDTLAVEISETAALCALRVAHGFKDHFTDVKMQAGALDFFDLLYLCRELLKNDLNVRRELADRYSHILIDEFQDTDPLQAEIVFFLSDSDLSSKVWEKVRLKPGKLTIVGDPKQSIYKFRRADIELYSSAKRFVTDSGGELLTISRNFRTVPDVVEWINTTFEQLFPSAGQGEPKRTPKSVQAELDQILTDDQADPDQTISDIQAEYVPLIADRDATPSCGVTFLFPAPEDEIGKSKPAWREAEAAAVAGWIERQVSEGTPIYDRKTKRERALQYSDHTLVVMRLTQLDGYMRAFEALDIPYVIDGGKHYFNSGELQDVKLILRALVRPWDEHSVIGALRSTMIGISDQELLEHRVRFGTFNYLRIKFHTVWKQDPTSSGSFKVCEALTMLKNLHLTKDTLPPDLLLENLLEQIDHQTFSWFTSQGRQSSANIKKLLSQFKVMHSARPMSLEELLAWLEERMATKAEEQLAIAGGDEFDAVKIMSSYKSKGLEFPVVILADIAGGGSDRAKPVEFITHRRSGKAGFKLPISLNIPRPSQGQRPRGVLASHNYFELKEFDHIRSQEEFKRTCYVAATRAREKLVIPLFAAQEDSKDAGFAKFLTSILPKNAAASEDPSVHDRLKEYADRFNSNVTIEQTAIEPLDAISHAPSEILWRLLDEDPHDGSDECITEIEDQLTRMSDETELATQRVSSLFKVATPVEISKPISAAERVRAFAGSSIGALVGTVVHRAIAEADLTKGREEFDRRNDLLVRAALEREHLTSAQVKEAIETISQCLDNFWRTPTAKGENFVEDTLLNADLLFCELPVQSKLNKGDRLLGKELTENTYIDGRLDLLSVTAGKATVIDLKTDRQMSDETLKEYEDQVRIYCSILQKELTRSTSPLKVTKGYLMLLRDATLHEVLL